MGRGMVSGDSTGLNSNNFLAQTIDVVASHG